MRQFAPMQKSGLAMSCSVLQCVAMCCSVMQRVAACCSALQCVAIHISPDRCIPIPSAARSINEGYVLQSVLQCVAVCCSVLQHTPDKCIPSIPAAARSNLDSSLIVSEPPVLLPPCTPLCSGVLTSMHATVPSVRVCLYMYIYVYTNMYRCIYMYMCMYI